MGRLERRHHETVAAALAAGAAARSPVVASWARSAQVHGLDPGFRPEDQRLTEGELGEILGGMEEVIRAAVPVLDRLAGVVGSLGACVVLADRSGIPVARRGKPGEDAHFARSGLWIGTRWSEAAAGTNGIGTCLAEGRPVVIHRDQHYLAANIGLTCISAPVHDAEGRLVAVLDVSTLGMDRGEGVIGLIGHTVTEAARQIEAELFHASFPKARMLLVPGTDRGFGAILAVDADELVIGATRAARQHLGQHPGLTADLRRAPIPAADLLGLEAHESPAGGERAVLARAVARAGGNLSAAARDLGLSRATLHRKLGRTAGLRPGVPRPDPD